MPKGYVIAHITVRDPERYQEYIRARHAGGRAARRPLHRPRRPGGGGRGRDAVAPRRRRVPELRGRAAPSTPTRSTRRRRRSGAPPRTASSSSSRGTADDRGAARVDGPGPQPRVGVHHRARRDAGRPLRRRRLAAALLRAPLLRADGTLWNAELAIGDCTILVGDAGGEGMTRTAFLYVHVPDVDATFTRAVEAGATAGRAAEAALLRRPRRRGRGHGRQPLVDRQPCRGRGRRNDGAPRRRAREAGR